MKTIKEKSVTKMGIDVRFETITNIIFGPCGGEYKRYAVKITWADEINGAKTWRPYPNYIGEGWKTKRELREDYVRLVKRYTIL